MKSFLAQLLCVSLLCAELHITVIVGGEESSLPVSKLGTLYFSNGDLQSSKGGASFSIENIEKITFVDKDIESILHGESLAKGSYSIKNTSESLSLSFSDKSLRHKEVMLYIVNTRGQVVHQERFINTTMQRAISFKNISFSAGFYTLLCRVQNKTIVEKIVIQ